MYAVEAEYIDSVVKTFGPGMHINYIYWNEIYLSMVATKMGAIVSGQVKFDEMRASWMKTHVTVDFGQKT